MSDAVRDTLGIHVALNASDVQFPGLRTIKILPWGYIESRNGRFVLDEEGAAAIVGAFDAHGVAVPIDLEHEGLRDDVAPERRRAVGWIEKLWFEEGRGVFGLVRWTDEGRNLIRGDQFRYLSPVVAVRKSDRRAVELHSAALTGKPAIPRMERLAASDKGMALLKGKNMDGLEVLKHRIGLNGGVTADQVVAACAAKPDELAAAVAELNSLKSSLHAAKGEAAVAAALKAGKLHANNAEALACAKALALNDPAGFEKLMGAVRSGFPPQGRMVYDDMAPPNAMSARETLIANAVREFRENAQIGKLTTMRAFVGQRLRDGGQVSLSDGEIRAFSIQG